MQSSKRGATIIVCEILTLLSNGPVTITRVVYAVNLNHTAARKFLVHLESRELVNITNLGEGRSYSITEKGQQVLKELRKTIYEIWIPQEAELRRPANVPRIESHSSPNSRS